MAQPKLKPFLHRLAAGSGEILMRYFSKAHRIERKRNAGIVTEADKAAEKFLLKEIFKSFPESSVITEESGEFHRAGDMTWVLDPLDGTSNYAHGFPWFCVSIGVMREGEPFAGIIFQPVTGELFYAERGRGATLNGRRIRVSVESRVRDALLGTGFYYHRGAALKREIDMFRRVQEVALGVRRPGSAALDLAYVACGRYEGFWERGLSPWDVAAGIVIVEEAGGRISDYGGKPTTVFDRELVASNGKIHNGILRLLNK